MKSACLDTPLGPMLAIADDKGLYLLEFTDLPTLPAKIVRLRNHTNSEITSGKNGPLTSLTGELEDYFAGTLQTFQTPLHLLGSPFQKAAWLALLEVPYGQTRTYQEQASLLGKESAMRATGRANGANQLAILIPCHRIINKSGNLGGYAGGLIRKQWLLDHERKYLP